MSLELQSFLVAIIVGAIFAAERLGGSEEVLRRVYQVTLAFALVFLTLSATTAFLRVESIPTNLSELAILGELGTDESSPAAERAREAGAIHVGVAFGLALAGITLFKRYQTIGLSMALGGLLLILVGSGGGNDLNSYLNSLTSLFGAGSAGQARDIIYFLVLAVGSLTLLAYGYQQWDAPEQ